MSKSNKIIAIAISATVAFCLVVVGITSLTGKKNPDAEFTSLTETVAGEAVSDAESSADANASVQQESQSAQSTAAGTTTTASGDEKSTTVQSNTAETTVAKSTTVSASTSTANGNSQDLSSAIIGKWMDSANMSGFEFFADGKVAFTYVNLSSFGVPLDGTANNGMYSLEGNILTIKFSIYTATIDKKYEISIENDVLSMKDIEENETSTYTRSKDDSDTAESTVALPTVSSAETTQAQTTTAAAATGTLEGRFLSGDKKSEITFNSDGTVNVKIKRDDFSGVYQITDDKVLIVYIDDGESISENYDFTIEGNILTLTSSKGEASVYVKQ